MIITSAAENQHLNLKDDFELLDIMLADSKSQRSEEHTSELQSH